MPRIILASSSPRRKEIFSKLGLDFEIIEPMYEEDMSEKTDAHELVKFLSLGKAQEVANRINGSAIVIGADTFVCLDGVFFGKPKDAADAKRMLETFSGKTHEIITGVAIIDTQTNTIINEAIVSTITMRALDSEEIDAYIATGEPMDKAGGYAIQERGAIFISAIHGDFFTIMGLPLYFVAEKLKQLGVRIL